jgi:hypothetical protein
MSTPKPFQHPSLRINGAGQLVEVTRVTSGAPRDCYACSLAWQSTGHLQVQCLTHGTAVHEREIK